MHAFHQNAIVIAVENAAFDGALRVLRLTGPPSDRRHGYVLIDIDERTYDAWGRPGLLPRKHLASLIERILTGDPALIILDIDASRQSESGDPMWHLLDEIRQGKHQSPPILITASLPARPETMPISELPIRTDEEGPLYLTSVRFERDADWTIRDWPLWTVACEVDRPRVLLALPVAAALLAASPDGHEAVNEFRESVTSTVGGACDELPKDPIPSAELTAGSLTLNLPPKRFEQRIFYRVPWIWPEGFSRPPIPGTSRPELEILSAGRFVAAGRPLATNRFANSIVVIGGSHAASRDIHRTHIGAMPGALVLVNAIDSILTHGQIGTPPTAAGLALVVIELVGLAALSALRPAFWALLMGVGGILLVLVPISLFWMTGGVWLDFALPVVGVFIHNLLSEYEEGRHSR